MASLKFTKDQIEVALKEIKRYADEALESLKEEDAYESLDGVERRVQKIDEKIDDIAFRLQDCDEY